MNPNFKKSKNLILKFAHINIILILTHGKIINKNTRSYLTYKRREKKLCIFHRRDNSRAAPRQELVREEEDHQPLRNLDVFFFKIISAGLFHRSEAFFV
jgi:hypothetical protein